MLQEWVFSARKRPLLMASLRCHRRSLRKQHLNWTSGTARTSRFPAGDTVFADEANLKKDGRPPSTPRNTVSAASAPSTLPYGNVFTENHCTCGRHRSHWWPSCSTVGERSQRLIRVGETFVLCGASGNTNLIGQAARKLAELPQLEVSHSKSSS